MASPIGSRPSGKSWRRSKCLRTERANAAHYKLSGFTKLFKDDMPHSYDFGELGRYYLRYERLMTHWQAVLPPGTIKTVVYEEVGVGKRNCESVKQTG